MSNEFDYTKLKHVTSVDQSDREVPYNLRQSGPTKVEMLISTRVRKSPYWHLSMQAKVMQLMPIMMTVLFLWFPSGLVLYWLTNGLLGILQQWYITGKIEAAYQTGRK